MVDFVYPSIFGIGASALFIVLLIACCVRWTRIHKIRRTNPVLSGECDRRGTNISSSVNRNPSSATAAHCPYPPPYSIQITPASELAPNSNTTAPNPYFGSYGLYPSSTESGTATSLTRLGTNAGSDQPRGPMPVCVTNINFPGTAAPPPPPPPYFEDRPPSYDDVLAAGKALMVAKIKKESEIATDSTSQRSNQQ